MIRFVVMRGIMKGRVGLLAGKGEKCAGGERGWFEMG